MPIPQRDRADTVDSEDDRPPRVAGTVRLMTEDPFEIDESATDLAGRVKQVLTDRPWLIPAALLGIGVAFLVMRRRR